jgi:hypothetical protein
MTLFLVSRPRRLLLIGAIGSTLALLPCGPADAQSQATTGQITGTVTDMSGGALAGATVRVSNAATGIQRQVVTNGQGQYAVLLLPAGAYALVVEAGSFRPTTIRDLQVTLGAVRSVDVQLELGAVSEALTVTSGPTPVEVTSAASSTTFLADTIANLPVNGRRFQDLVVLTPNAQLDIQRGQIALAGQRGVYLNINVDGGDYTEPFFGGIRGGSRSNFAPTIPFGAIAEFQVIPGGHSVEFGRSPGGLVNVVTRSGTNRVLGSSFYVNRPRELAADNVFRQPASPSQQQWGGSFSAPIRPDRVFIFAAFEQQGSDLQRAVLFDSLQSLTPNDRTREAFDFLKGLEEPFTQTNDAVTWLGRVDVMGTAGSRLAVRYSGSRNVGLNAISPGNISFPTVAAALSSSGTERDRTNTIVGEYTDARRANRLLEVRAQLSHEARPRDANAIAARVMSDVGRFGTTAFLGENLAVDWRAQSTATVTWMTGAHTFKTGVDVIRVVVDSIGGLNQTGGFTIAGTNPDTILEIMSVGGPTPNRFDSPSVTYLRQIGNLRQTIATNEAAAFVQDTWRVRRALTVTLGLRWDAQWNPSPEANNDSLTDRLEGFTFPSGRHVDPNTIPDQAAQFAPRGGIAWNPWGRSPTVIRAHAGLYYGRTPGLIFAGPLGNFRVPPADLSVQLPLAVPPSNPNKSVYQQLKLVGIDLNHSMLGGLPIVSPEQVARIAEALGLPFDPYNGAQPVVVDPNFRNPRGGQLGLGVEHELLPGMTLSADYSDVRTSHLERNRDLNMPLPFVRPTDPAERPFFGLRSGRERPIPTLGAVTVRESSARSHYRALSFKTRVRRSWGQIHASYVLGKSLSDDDNEADIGGMVAENAYDFGPEYSFARLDRRHQVSGGAVFLLPRDLSAAVTVQFRSGLPIDARVGNDANDDRSTGADRPYRAPGVPFERHLFRNRSTSTVDLHLSKAVASEKGRRLAVSLDLFNLFNASNIQYAGSEVTNYCAAPVPTTCGFAPPSNPNFLQVFDRHPESERFGEYLLNNTPGDPRQIQLGLRLSF